MRLQLDAVLVQFTPGAGVYGHSGADDAAFDAALIATFNQLLDFIEMDQRRRTPLWFIWFGNAMQLAGECEQ